MKKILVTGATGYLGSHLVKALLKEPKSQIFAILGRPEDNTNVLPNDERIEIISCEDVFNYKFDHIDTLIHTAFSRGENLSGLTSSLSFTRKIIEMVNTQNIDSFINISSQGVYKELKPSEKVDENGTVEPNTVYGLAKWAVENMLMIGCKKHYTNIRMASLSANARFLYFFVKSVIDHRDITITAPHQYASIMDVSDAVNGILAIENLSLSERNHTYNLGPGTQYSILDYAEHANNLGIKFGFSPVNLIIDDNGKESAICMDCSRLMKQTAWSPNVLIEEMIFNLFKKYKD